LKRLLRRTLLLLVRFYGAAGARRARRLAHQPVRAHPRILLLRPDYLGDLLLTTPVLNALKATVPGAHITMMVGPWSADVVARHPAIEQLVLCPFPGVRGDHKQSLRPVLLLRTARHLRKEHYDLAINLRFKSWWISALIYLAGIPRRVGFASHLSSPLLTHSLPERPHEHLSATSLRLLSAGLESLGYTPLAEPYTPQHYPLYFRPTGEEQHWARQRLRREGIDPDAQLIVIHPGAGAAVKLWRTGAWAYCASWLSQFLAGISPVHFILTGTVAEQPLLEEIACATTARTTVLTGMTIGQLAAVFQQAQLVLGVDSGPLHLAVAQAIPTVRIYGPIDPRIFGPWGSQDQHTVVVSTHRCTSCAANPCGHLSFPERELKRHPCVKLVPEQQVLDAIAEHLSPFVLTPHA
jgi:ADP-heptose:LPS heptosyltransferase